MREIKFRAWNNVKNKMGEPFYLAQVLRITANQNEYKDPNFDPFIFMQYTGLKDKNGKEIYEGDIVECSITHEGKSLPHAGEVVFSEFGSFSTKNEAGETPFLNHQINTREVIGNIYQNPELL